MTYTTFSRVPLPKIDENTFVSPSVIPTMPQLRAPRNITSRATGSSRFSISILLPPEKRSASCESTRALPLTRFGVTPANGVCALPVPGSGRQASLVEVRPQLRDRARVGRVHVVGVREMACANVLRVGADPGNHLVVDLGAALDELRHPTGRHAQQVVEYEHLAVGGQPGADPDHR